MPDTSQPKARFTLVRAIRPATLTKSIRLEGGHLIATPAANMMEGIAIRLAVADVEAFARIIEAQAGHGWAICTGISRHARARVYTKRELATLDAGQVDKTHLPSIARSKDHMGFVPGPALLALDYDPPKEADAALTARELNAVLCGCCPWLAEVAKAIFASSSSYIYRTSTGEQLKGGSGLHVYMIADDGRHAPRITDAIFQATFAAYGFALITKSGSIYPRSLVDRSVPQPERLLFEAGVILADDLEQRRGAPHLIPGGRLAVATVPTCSEYQTWRDTDPVWMARKNAAEPEAARVRRAWIAERLASGRISRATLERAVLGGTLGDDFEITLASGETVSIAAIRADMPRYEGMPIPDPLEPDYRGGSLCAVIFPWGIFSQARGGYRLRFERTSARLNFSAYEPEVLDFSIAPEKDELNFDD